jgi:signal transduction histidine kinase
MTENLERATRERQQSVRDLESLNQTLEAKVSSRTAELQEALAAQQRLIRDISHEIKSPLARLDVALGLARRTRNAGVPKQFDRMEREIGNISALASELLTLARLDGAADAVTFAPVDLAMLIHRIVQDAAFELPQRQQDVAVHIFDEGLMVEGNVELLHRALENVVRNAFFYTELGTPVEIALSHHRQDRILIQITDCGPGVPLKSLAHLFEPFYRVDEARARKTGGTGIGLAICQRVVALHDGAVSARANEPNGLIVEIELPVRRPD